MKKTTFVKKIQLIPLGGKEEKDRIYQYYRDAQYNQYLALNQLMSEVGMLYYHYKRDIQNSKFKEAYKAIFKRDSVAYDNVAFPKGGHLQGNVSRKVQADFSTALKNGLAKGERQLPRYRRDFPYLIHNVELKFYRNMEEYEGKEKEIFCIKTVNRMRLKVVLGSRGRRDCGLMSLLNELADENPDYKINQSSLYFDKNNKMILNLTVTKTIDDTYVPVENRVMGVSYGFNVPIQIAFNDLEKTYVAGEAQNFIDKRIAMQKHFSRIQSALKECKGGRGRSHKLRALERFHQSERNFAKTYNHVLSKRIVQIAVDNQAEIIILESVSREDLANYPVLLRNWSYYELSEYVKYKAERMNIKVLLADAPSICSACEKELNEKEQLPDEIIWTKQVSFACPHCGKVMDYGINKAKLLATNPIM